MKLLILVHEADEGGYWAEAPSIPGCATQGDSLEELLENMREAVAAAYPSMFGTFLFPVPIRSLK